MNTITERAIKTARFYRPRRSDHELLDDVTDALALTMALLAAESQHQTDDNPPLQRRLLSATREVGKMYSVIGDDFFKGVRDRWKETQ
jgi:hypothetical protein